MSFYFPNLVTEIKKNFKGWGVKNKKKWKLCTPLLSPGYNNSSFVKS